MHYVKTKKHTQLLFNYIYMYIEIKQYNTMIDEENF